MEINDLGYAFSPLFLFKSREEVDSFITDITALLSIGPLPNSQGGRGDEPYGDAHGTPGDLELGKDGWMSPRDSMIKGIPLTHGFDTNANGQSVSECCRAWLAIAMHQLASATISMSLLTMS